MGPRLLLPSIALMLTLGVMSAAQQPPFSVRITSPVDDGYISGPMRLVAVIEPASAVRQIKEVVFFADAHKVCTVTKPPFQCDWDAGDQIVQHTVRVTAELSQGGRAVATVHTRGVKFAEA
ncbi:MAG TPA: Ig-like domain-containing protein, partial [Vicinamibacterales bacterium]|nr:Ig-like domain-containing protein [Vicinamibacterales bacterium]